MKHAHIYNELVRFYNRSRRKLQCLAVEGKNLRKQNILQKRIVRLFKTLTRLQRILKLGIATAALSAGMLLFQPNAAQAQASFEVVQTNPFGLTSIGNSSKPALADLDGDGDMDLVSGESSGNFLYFENIGTAIDPAFAAAQTNPFGLTDIDNHSAPAFADLDGDGDMDLLAGVLYGFRYFENIGTANAPAFAAPQTDPFGLSNVSFYHAYGTPAFADLDGDGDMDLMKGNFGGKFYYFKNIGTATDPAFAEARQNRFGLTDIGSYPAPAFTDLDEDGDMDMMSGENGGNFIYFQNTGTALAPAFAPAQSNPFDLTGIGYESAPAFTDLDADGDIDMMAGAYYGNFFYFENTTPCTGLNVYADADLDSYGDAANSLFVADCIVPEGYVKNSTDCNDTNASIHPGATELANGIDDNCNGIIDECPALTGFSESNISATSAKLNWNAIAQALSYKVRYKVAGTTDWTKITNINSNSKVISGLAPNTIYYWEAKSVCSANPIDASDWSAKQSFITGSLRIGDESVQQVSFQIYPNPAEDHATIQFTLAQSSQVSIKVYDVSGKEIACPGFDGETLLDAELQQGEHSLQIKTHHFPKGVYMVRMISDLGIENQKLIVE